MSRVDDPAQDQPEVRKVTSRNLRTSVFITALVAVLGLVQLGCGDAGDDIAGITTTSSTTSSTTANDSEPGSAAALGIASTNLGDVLVTESGRTLYVFTPDGTDGATCVDACAQTWPPLTTEGTPSGKDLSPGLLGTVERRDGSTQVTAAGHPLYMYSGDSEEGDTNGEGIDGTWFAASNTGEPIKKSPSSDQVPLTQPY
ncbi:MAG: hypothetical protein WBA45_05555 [Microthrixaceae bacterium]